MSAINEPRVNREPRFNNTDTYHYHNVEGLSNSGTNKPSAKLDIGIVGAGLAGLGAAIALRRKGFAVEVGSDCRFPSKFHEI